MFFISTYMSKAAIKKSKPAPVRKAKPKPKAKPAVHKSQPSSPAKKKAASSASAPAYNSNITLVTKEGLKKMMDELEDLKINQLTIIAAKLKEAVAQGDLSENAEYAETKERQQMALLRIAELEDQIRHAEIIKKSACGSSQSVTLGCLVTVRNLTRDKEKETYQIVGSVEANAFDCKISNNSPLGSSLIGKKKGDQVTIKAPVGDIIYEIAKVE